MRKLINLKSYRFLIALKYYYIYNSNESITKSINMRKCLLLLALSIAMPSLSHAQIQLWGMTGGGGISSDGTVFMFSPSSSSINTVVSFNGSNGGRPCSSLIQAPDGFIYGMTQAGGASGNGNIFRCTPSGKLTSIASFNGRNGSSPSGDLLYGADGNLYGMTVNGGANDSGEIFQCTTSGAINVLVSFNGATGVYPYGSLIQGIDGNLYGMAMYGGGAGDSGTIFKCTTSGNLTTLYNFNCSNGGYPYNSLIQGTDGNLYGMTLYGGSADSGVIFKCSTKGEYTTLVNLNAQTGCFPYGNLVQGTDGSLYGMTQAGGAYSGGTLFKCTTSGTINVLVNFNDTIGQSPMGSLILASDSNFYGMTTAGGASGAGFIFQYNSLGKLTNLARLTGALYACSPVRQYGKLLEVNPTLGLNEISLTNEIKVYPVPARDILNIVFDNPFKGNIQISDMSGRNLMTLDLTSNRNKTEIDISTLSSGVYFVEIENSTNRSVYKFVKE
jgi:uncharacterized repeat protein (TIGR03803 family)